MNGLRNLFQEFKARYRAIRRRERNGACNGYRSCTTAGIPVGDARLLPRHSAHRRRIRQQQAEWTGAHRGTIPGVGRGSA